MLFYYVHIFFSHNDQQYTLLFTQSAYRHKCKQKHKQNNKKVNKHYHVSTWLFQYHTNTMLIFVATYL